jgi:hypothetical protein
MTTLWSRPIPTVTDPPKSERRARPGRATTPGEIEAKPTIGNIVQRGRLVRVTIVAASVEQATKMAERLRRLVEGSSTP